MDEQVLSESEIMALVFDYIGVDDGYLRDFTYKTHEAFYPRFCDRQIDVKEYRKLHGTTREAFLAILREAAPPLQARIVEGVFEFLPFEQSGRSGDLRAAAAKERLERAVARLRGQSVLIGDLSLQSQAVKHAIDDAEVLIRERGTTSGVDRIHTALHGYLRSAARIRGIDAPDDADAPRLFKLLRDQVPELEIAGGRPDDVKRIQGALATVVAALSPIRNQASMAHPNENLLDSAEAGLVLDAARSLLNYLDRKLRVTSSR